MKRYCSAFLLALALAATMAGCSSPTAPGEPPQILAFFFRPDTVALGQSVEVHTTVRDAANAYIYPDIGDVRPDATSVRTFTPTETKEYLLTAVNEFGTVERRVTLTVIQ